MVNVSVAVFMPVCRGTDVIVDSQVDLVSKIMRSIYIAQNIAEESKNIATGNLKRDSLLHILGTKLKKPANDLDFIISDLKDNSSVPIFLRHVSSYAAGCGLAAEMYSDLYQIIKSLEDKSELSGTQTEKNQLKYCLAVLVSAYSFSADVLYKALESASPNKGARNINEGFAELAGPRLIRQRLGKIKKELSDNPNVTRELNTIMQKKYGGAARNGSPQNTETGVPLYS